MLPVRHRRHLGSRRDREHGIAGVDRSLGGAPQHRQRLAALRFAVPVAVLAAVLVAELVTLLVAGLVTVLVAVRGRGGWPTGLVCAHRVVSASTGGDGGWAEGLVVPRSGAGGRVGSRLA